MSSQTDNSRSQKSKRNSLPDISDSVLIRLFCFIGQMGGEASVEFLCFVAHSYRTQNGNSILDWVIEIRAKGGCF